MGSRMFPYRCYKLCGRLNILYLGYNNGGYQILQTFGSFNNQHFIIKPLPYLTRRMDIINSTHIMVKKIYSLNCIKISYILTDIYDIKIEEHYIEAWRRDFVHVGIKLFYALENVSTQFYYDTTHINIFDKNKIN